MTGERGPSDLSDLQSRIDAARAREEGRARPGPGKRALASGYGMAVRLAIEMVAALGVSVFLGLWIDGELGTAPLFLIVFLVMGMGAGIMNVYRTVGRQVPGPPRAARDGRKAADDEGGGDGDRG